MKISEISFLLVISTGTWLRERSNNKNVVIQVLQNLNSTVLQLLLLLELL
jgi:hypothetical protein